MGPDEVKIINVADMEESPEKVFDLAQITITFPTLGYICDVSMTSSDEPVIDQPTIDAVSTLVNKLLNELLLQVFGGSVN